MKCNWTIAGIRSAVLFATLAAALPSLAADNGVGRIVRIPTPIQPKCINAKTDEVTMTLRYVKTHKRNGFLTNQNKAGVTVITTLNSDGNQKAQHPSVNLVSVQDAQPGQIYLPLEYPIASLLPLSQDSGRTFTKNMLLELYFDKTRGANTFGTILDVAGQLLGKLPIPSNPYTNAASQVVEFATTSIKNQSADAGGQLFASVTLQFNDRDQNIAQCQTNNFEATGAIAIVGAQAADNVMPLPLSALNSAYCWTYVSNTTYEVQYAPRPAAGCGGVAASAYHDVPNDYVMMVLSAASTLPALVNHNIFSDQFDDIASRGGRAGGRGVGPVSKRQRELDESKKLCGALKINAIYCGTE